jgi:hypothetical protein
MDNTFFVILISVIISVLINYGINKIAKHHFFRKNDEISKKKFLEIKHLLKELDYLKFKKKENIKDEVLMRMILDYSMRTRNIENGLRFFNTVKKLKTNPEIDILIDNATDTLKERFKNENNLKFNKAA